MCCTSAPACVFRSWTDDSGRRSEQTGSPDCAEHYWWVTLRTSRCDFPLTPSVLRGCRLDELDEHAAGVLGVHEVDPALGGAAARGVVEQADAALLQDRGDLLDVGDPVG